VSADYDLVVIGGGTAGLGAALAGAADGARTLLAFEGEIGGECTFTRCVPSKTLIEAAARGATFPVAIAAVHRVVATFEVEGGAVRPDRPVITEARAGPQWMCA
jgi:pyruvate/2-oxoglutarate dehydrogenase complex dihydrolipoamide dehydrogenase (E3) component